MNKVAEGDVITEDIKLAGIRLKQCDGSPYLYVFAMDGKTLADQVGVQRMEWHDKLYKTEGFQRVPNNMRVAEIAEYLNTQPIMPNIIVVNFEHGALEFEPGPGIDESDTGQPTLGKLTIHTKLLQRDDPLEPLPEEQRIGYVIDGQHRLYGVRESHLTPGTWPILVSAFEGTDTKFQLNQFYILNQTVKIPEAQLTMLRTELQIKVSGKEAQKRAIAEVRQLLVGFPDSPFRINENVRIPKIAKRGTINVTVVDKIIEIAITETRLRDYWRKSNANEITEGMKEKVARSLFVFWKAVSQFFPDYWGRKPSEQRLFAAIGLYSVMRLYDNVMQDVDVESNQAVPQAQEKLRPLEGLPWDKMQNLPTGTKHPYPDALLDGLKDLWQARGERPYQFQVKAPTGECWVDLRLS